VEVVSETGKGKVTAGAMLGGSRQYKHEKDEESRRKTRKCRRGGTGEQKKLGSGLVEG